MQSPFVLAHLSDPHLPPLPLPAFGEWDIKRALGVLNWHRKRKFQHLPATLDRLLADLAAQPVDHIAVTGDLVNVGLPVEIEAARRWLAAVGPPDTVTVVPGNHDIYVDLGDEPGVARWQAHMVGNPEAHQRAHVDASCGDGFPFARCFGAVVLIGLNSAVVTPPLYASGRLGPAQLRALAGLLERTGRAGLVRVVLIHHPPVPGLREARCALEDASALSDVLQQHGAELVLHGHNHRAMLTFVDGPDRAVPIVGVPSASLGLAHGRQTLARYNLYRLTSDPAAPIEMIERGLAEPGGGIVEVGRRYLAPPVPAMT